MTLDDEQIRKLLKIHDPNLLIQMENTQLALENNRLAEKILRKAYYDSIQDGIDAGIPQAVIAETLGISRQRVRQLMRDKIVFDHKEQQLIQQLKATETEYERELRKYNEAIAAETTNPDSLNAKLQAYNAEMLERAEFGQSESDDRSTDDGDHNHESD